MGIRLEYMNSIVIRIDRLCTCPGIANVQHFFDDLMGNGIGCQRDEHLLVVPGACNGTGQHLSLEFFKQQGLMPAKRIKGELHWHDVCELDSSSGPTLPCSWLEWDAASGTVSLKESEQTVGTVIIAHGKESGPQGNKIKALALVARKHRLLMIAPDFRGMDDPEERVCHLLDQVRGCTGPVYLAGSSMGGYVAIRASQKLQPTGLFLMAPAIGIPGYADHELAPGCRQISVVHAWEDDIIPVGNVIAWSERYKAELHLIHGNHRLSEQVSLLKFLFDEMLCRQL